MFGTIRRHQTWLWIIIIALTIVSFVVFFSPDARWRGGGSAGLGTIDGKKVTVKDFRDAQQETRLLYFLNFQQWPENDERASQMDFDIERETFARLLRLAKVKQAGIDVSDEAVGEMARRLLGGMPLDRFAQQFLLPHGVTLDDFERFVRNDVAIQQLAAVAGLSGKLVTPGEAEAVYRREHQQVEADLVFFSASNYLSTVTVTDAAISQWYSNRMAMFRIPERVRVSYVAFTRTNFYPDADKQLNQVTNLTGLLEDVYHREGTNSFLDKEGKPLPMAAAIEQLKTRERDKLAMFFARKKANEFAGALYDKEPKRAENLETLAAEQKLEVKVSPPLSREEFPENSDLPPMFARAAYSLTKEEPISVQEVEGENGYYVLALKETLPSETPSLEKVRDKVVEDYRRSQAFTQARFAGTSFQNRLTNGLAQGKPFQDIAQEAKVTPVTVRLSPATESLPEFGEQINLRQLKAVVLNLDPGEASNYIPNPPDGGFLAYVRGRVPIDEVKLQQELPSFLTSMRQYRQNEAFGQWFRKQAERADLPLARKPRPAAGGSSPPDSGT